MVEEDSPSSFAEAARKPVVLEEEDDLDRSTIPG